MKTGAKVKKSYTHWNNIKYKPDNVNIKANEEDIVMKINKYWFVCQTKNGFNNLICYLPRGEHSREIVAVRSMFEFVYRLATEYKIKCIRIQGNPRRYAFIDRFFPDVTVKKEAKNGDVIRYCLLDEPTIEKLNLLRKTKV